MARPRTRENRPTRGTWAPGLLTLTVLLVAATGCTVPSEPDRPAWRQLAVQTLQDTASELATVQLVLRQERSDHLPGRYAVVVAVDTEERAGKTSQGFTSQQPPAGARPAYERVGSLLDDADGLLSESRIALADGATEDYGRLIVRLGRLGDRVDRAQGRFE